MNSEIFPLYRHSGKITLYGLALALIVPAITAFPLGFIYAYLLKWIPFVYLNVLLTGGLGFVVGFLTGWLLKIGKVRNNSLAAICGLCAGFFALYFDWNGHVSSLIKQAPILCTPHQIMVVAKVLYKEGSWGMRSGGAVTGIPLAIVWFVEAGIIIGVSTLVSYAMISKIPFCERTGCWLDETKTISTFEAFKDPIHVEALKARDLSPLSEARPRPTGASEFGRLTVKFSSRCNEFCTASIANISVSMGDNDKMKETEDEIVGDIVLPKSFFEFLERFEKLKPPPPQLSNF